MISDTIKAIRAKGIKQWRRDRKSAKHDATNAWFDVISYDEDTKRYRLDRTTIKEESVPPDALSVTGGKNHYATVICPQPKRAVRDENGKLETSAISNYLYMINNDINDALASILNPHYVNWKLLGVLGIGAVAVIYIVVTRLIL